MSLLYPLGLIALIGILILLLIYLIRPNYQNKYVTSTFVWKLSLKYKKKKLPTSKLRNIILIICQILIIALIAWLVSTPIRYYDSISTQKEAIAILDSSASMRTESNGETRYERAVRKIKEQSQSLFQENGLLTVVTAGPNPEILIEKASVETQSSLEDELNKLIDEDNLACTYGTSDIDGAIEKCYDLLVDNPDAKVYLYTDLTYTNIPSNVTVVDCKESEEWNAAIVNAYTEYTNNYYDVIVDVASYGRDTEITVNVEVNGANAADRNDDGQQVKFSYTVQCSGNETSRVVFKASDAENVQDSENVFYTDVSSSRFFSYKDVRVYVDEGDNYNYDDQYYLYDGLKEVIKIQYASTIINKFVNAALLTLQSEYAAHYDIQITEVKLGSSTEGAATEGFDYYIFEHEVPSTLPKDGVIIILDPNTSGTDYKIGSEIDYSARQQPLTQEVSSEESSLLRLIDCDKITVSRIRKITSSDGYQVLATVDNNPVLLAKKDGDRQVFIMSFSVHYSNIALTFQWPMLWQNILLYYTPYVVSGNAESVYEDISVNGRGEKLTITNDSNSTEYTTFPVTFTTNTPGTYRITQTTYFGDDLTDEIYVRVPSAESNIQATVDSMAEPYSRDTKIRLYDDLMFWFAVALVALVFVEWWLKNRDNA